MALYDENKWRITAVTRGKKIKTVENRVGYKNVFCDGLMWHPLLGWLFSHTTGYRPVLSLFVSQSLPLSISLIKPLFHKLCLSLTGALRQSVKTSAVTGLGS